MARNSWVQGVALIVAAIAIAIVANGFASPQRHLKLPGWYPPHSSSRVAETPSRPVETVTTTTVAPVTTTTATVAPPVTTTTAVTTTTVAPPSPTRPPAPSPTPTTTTAPAADRFQPHPDAAYVEIAGDDVATLHARGALFLDARRTSVYEQGHIAGSRSFSVWESDIDDKVAKLFEERSDPREQNQPIVIYCSGGACEDSHMLAQKLWGVQFNNVYVYKDGFPDWQNRGGAVRTGGQP